MKPAYHYDGSDDDSMADNNSSAFNCRKVGASNKWSEHSYGQAIDINPLWNPWVKGSTILPKSGAKFAERDQKLPGMVYENDPIVLIFERYGWQWGSQKSGINDYQHFTRLNGLP